MGALLLLIAAMLAPPSASAQFRDRTAPTAPTNLHVTALTAYTLSLAWNPSTDNSGKFSYRIQADGWGGGTVAVSQASTSATLQLSAGYKYSVVIYAIDASGNKSKASNLVEATLPADRTAPTAPVLSLFEASTSTASLKWEPSVDDGPYVSYQVLINGAPSLGAGGGTSITVQGLSPSRTYAFAVQGRDNWQNWSPVSNEITVTTNASDPNDTTPPTPPTNLTTNGMVFQDGEIWLFWTQSTDNVDAQSAITYDVFVNGRLDHRVVGRGTTVLYGDVPGPNVISIVAVDVAGNRSTAASMTID
jgi:chitodextrinase